MCSDQLMEAAHTLDAFRQPSGREPPTIHVLKMDVVMSFGPIMTNEHRAHLHLLIVIGYRARGDQQRPNGSVLEARHPSSHPRSTSPTSRRTI